MNSNIQINIGNHEIVNLLVEERVREMRAELESEKSIARAVKGEIKGEARRLWEEHVTAKLEELNSDGHSLRTSEALHFLGFTEAVENIKWAADRDVGRFVSSRLIGGGMYVYLHLFIVSDDGTLSGGRVIPDKKLKVPQSELELSLFMKLKVAQDKIKSLKSQLNQRDRIANECLAHVTRATLNVNPELLQQVQAITLLVRENTQPLLS